MATPAETKAEEVNHPLLHYRMITTMKIKLFLSLAAAFVTVAALAQDPSVYIIGQWNGMSTTNQAVGPTLSVTNTVATSEYNSAKLYVAVRGDGATTANALVKLYRSLDSTTYETTGTTNLIAMNGTTEVNGIINLPKSYLANVGVLKVVIENTNAATRSITNIQALVRYNAPSVRIKGN